MLAQRGRLAHELGDPSEIRAERDGLARAVTQLIREHTDVREQLAEREVQTPSPWAQRTLGERPGDPRLCKEWDQGARQAARYRLQYDVTDPDDPLGTEPQQGEQQRNWQRARDVLIAAGAAWGVTRAPTTASPSRSASDLPRASRR